MFYSPMRTSVWLGNPNWNFKFLSSTLEDCAATTPPKVYQWLAELEKLTQDISPILPQISTGEGQKDPSLALMFDPTCL